MRILIGIPSFRRSEQLARLIASLERQQAAFDHRVELFVADNDPERHQAKALCDSLSCSLPLHAEIEPELGIAAARNRLLREARKRGARFLAMIDDDEIASPQWLSALLAAQAARQSDITGGPVRYVFAKPPSSSLLRSGAFNSGAGRRSPDGVLNATGNVLFDCEALARLGWPMFDIAFGLSGGEDKEYFTRLAGLGLRFGWASDAIVEEYVPADRMSTASVYRRAHAIGSSDYRIVRMHGPGRASATHLLKSVVVMVAAVPLAPLFALPGLRLWLLRRIARATGRLAAALGMRRVQYGPSISH